MVGTATGNGLSKLGHQVIFYDVDKNRIRLLKASNKNVTSKIDEAIGKSEISYICVPTPFEGNRMNLDCIKSAVVDLAKSLTKRKGYHLVVVKSTILPKTSEETIVPLLEEVSEKKVGVDIGFCVNPEFLTEISKTWTSSQKFSKDFQTEDRIVIGEFDTKSGDLLAGLYEYSKIPIIRTDMRTAEMIKFASNCALSTRISYWNEIYYMCQLLKIDSNLVAEVSAMDARIGKYGTVHGKAFGGKCLPKDLQALIKFSQLAGYEPLLLKAVLEINDKIRSEKGARE